MSDRYAKYNKLKFDYPADRVLRITFDRPESFNSVDAETHTQMTDMWIDIDNDPDINAVIVTGAVGQVRREGAGLRHHGVHLEGAVPVCRKRDV